MKTLVLDSTPTVPMHIPSATTFHIGPPKRGRGPPLLGMRQPKYTHFVPLGEGSKELKKLLELPESDTSPPKLVKAYTEMLKQPQGKEPEIVDPAFKEASQQYLNAPKANKEETFLPQGKEEAPPIIGKNRADLANEVAVDAPKRKKVTPAPRKLLAPASPKKMKKKTAVAPKKLTSFRVVGKKKK